MAPPPRVPEYLASQVYGFRSMDQCRGHPPDVAAALAENILTLQLRGAEFSNSPSTGTDHCADRHRPADIPSPGHVQRLRVGWEHRCRRLWIR